MRAYSELYLQNAQTNLAMMLDTAVNGMGFKLDMFYRMFLMSGVADAFSKGFTKYLCGMSGAELAAECAERTGRRVKRKDLFFSFDRSREYWTGFALAWYQWSRAVSFHEIEERVPVTEIRDMYMPYHEMDLLQFADETDRRMRARMKQTKLSLRRQAASVSQRQLAEASGVPVRTIQQYEQRVKDINRAGADTLRALSGALFCEMEDLMEAV